MSVIPYAPVRFPIYKHWWKYAFVTQYILFKQKFQVHKAPLDCHLVVR